jgi:hypothetical protein
MRKPAYNGQLYFAGEASSACHAYVLRVYYLTIINDPRIRWVAGTLDSTWMQLSCQSSRFIITHQRQSRNSSTSGAMMNILITMIMATRIGMHISNWGCGSPVSDKPDIIGKYKLTCLSYTLSFSLSSMNSFVCIL